MSIWNLWKSLNRYTRNSLFLGVSFIQQTSGKKFYLADPAEQWDAINGVGLRNHFLCTVYASRMMVERKNGLIVNVSSPGGLRLVKICLLKKLFSKAFWPAQFGLCFEFAQLAWKISCFTIRTFPRPICSHWCVLFSTRFVTSVWDQEPNDQIFPLFVVHAIRKGQNVSSFFKL